MQQFLKFHQNLTNDVQNVMMGSQESRPHINNVCFIQVCPSQLIKCTKQLKTKMHKSHVYAVFPFLLMYGSKDLKEPDRSNQYEADSSEHSMEAFRDYSHIAYNYLVTSKTLLGLPMRIIRAAVDHKKASTRFDTYNT